MKNYIIIAHFHTSQFDFTSRFLVTALNNEDSPVSVFPSVLSGEYPANELTQQPKRKHRLQQFLYYCYGPLLRNDCLYFRLL
jgi:hypothetical protein